MSVESTREVMDRYFGADHSDETALADDVVFRVMATGEEARGPEAAMALLRHFYGGAFKARAQLRNLVIGDGHAVGEWDFVGTHTGEFAGVPATGRQVNVPLAVAYDVTDDRIVAARIYFETPAFLAQVAVSD